MRALSFGSCFDPFWVALARFGEADLDAVESKGNLAQMSDMRQERRGLILPTQFPIYLADLLDPAVPIFMLDTKNLIE